MSTLNYAYLNTRISILAVALLPRGSMPASGELLDDSGAVSGGGVSVEQAQLSKLLADVQLIVRPLTGPDRDLLIHAIHLYELANLKTIIRGKLAGLARDAIEAELFDLGDFATLPMDDLLRTEDAPEALRRLETTPYFGIARQARRIYEQGQDMFAVDAAIDRQYLAGLKHRALSVSRRERGAVAVVAGALMDRTNLVWLLRYRFSYDFAPAATYYQLVPSTASMTAERLRSLARLPSFQDVVDALPEPLARWVSGVSGIAEVEDRLEGRLESICDAVLKRQRHPVARAFAYLVRRDLDMRRMIAVIKGLRLGLDADLVRTAAHLAD